MVAAEQKGPLELGTNSLEGRSRWLVGSFVVEQPRSAASEAQSRNPQPSHNVESANKEPSLQHTTCPSEDTLTKSARSFDQQIAAFLILEFGIIFHSVIIGLNLGVTGSEFATLYPVLVFHQSFEGLGIGARLSAIPFAQHKVLPYMLCLAYGLTTPISIAIGLGLRTTYNPKSKESLIIQGVFNAVSAGVLIYSALVELLARDFLFDPDRTRKRAKLVYMVFCMLLGAGIMALIGEWA
ncbi:Zinc/iron permease [Aspergillus heterothallicus]